MLKKASTQLKSKLFVFTWSTLIALLISYLAIYSNTSGTIGKVQNKWPIVSKINIKNQQENFLIFLHPECSCSHATLGELE